MMFCDGGNFAQRPKGLGLLDFCPYIPIMPPMNETSGAPAPGFKTLLRFLPFLWPKNAAFLRLRVVASLLLVFASILATLTNAYALKYAIDRMAPGLQSTYAIAVFWIGAYVIGRFSAVLFDNLRNGIFERVGQVATQRLATHVFEHLHKLSLRFHLDRRTGAVSKVIERGTKSIDTMLYFMLFNIAPTVIQLTLVLGIFWRSFGLPLFTATLISIILYIVFTWLVTNWRTKLRIEMNTMDTNAMARAVDSLLNYETVKYFNAEARETARYGRAAMRYANAAVKNEVSLAWLNIGQSFITNTLMVLALAYTAWLWSKGQSSAGGVVFVQTLLAQLFRPLDMLGMVYRTIRQGLIDMDAMFALVDTKAEIVDVPHAPPLAVTHGVVQFEDVQFHYDKNRPILKGLNFTVPAGGTLAVVGSSGAGKSTLARLLYRFYDVTGGRILIDGQDIAKVAQESLRAAIGIVPQDTVLFNDTIGYNIAYGREGAGEKAVAAAARGAAISDFISSLPEGYETSVGERGLKLSGGEKQRVAIARTLVKDPPILILDEATSALDSRTEAEIQATLNEVSARRTTITIAHRLSTIVDADEIIVLEHGQIVERGTHASLLRSTGVYYDMWQRQNAEQEGAS